MNKQPSLTTKLYDHRYLAGLIVVIGLAIYFRFTQLGTLPPGLSDAEAMNANSVMNVINKTQSFNGLLQQGLGQTVTTLAMAVSAKLNGSTAFALRLPMALLGIVGVIVTYGWINSWFGRKTALIAALLLAVTPWSVGLSRTGISTAGTIVIVPTVLWLLTLAMRSKRLVWQLAAGAALGISTASIAGLWFLIGLALAIVPLLLLRRKFDKKLVRRLGLVLGAALLLGIPTIGFRLSSNNIQLTQVTVGDFSSAASRVSQTLGMFNIHGDNDFHYNIGGTPELNLFVGLMFLVGLLVCIMRISQARYRVLLILFGSLLIPAMMASSGTPNSLLALIAAPVIFAIAALGIIYMLDVWYSTFPINSAARTLGTVPIVLLLLMSVYQSHKQYFVAWAKSPEVYTAYNENSTAVANYLNRAKPDKTRYVITEDISSYTIKYLTTSKSNYTEIKDTQIASLPDASTPIEVIFITPQQNDVIAELKKRYPKAKLSQHYSEFNDNNQLFAVYQVNP